MTVLRPDQIRVLWYGTRDGEERRLGDGKIIGWVAFVPFPLAAPQLEKLKEVTLRELRHRFAGLPESPAKVVMAKTIRLLEKGKVLQMLLTDKEREDYERSLPKDDRKIISVGKTLPSRPLNTN